MTAPAGTGARGLPCYLVLDTSASMTPYETLLNATLTEIHDTLFTNPQLTDFIHMSILAFNSEAHVVVGMREITQLQRVPDVSCGGSTNYAPMFQLVRKRIDLDVPTLAEARINVLRPVVFLLTDGAPTDESAETWRSAFRDLTDEQYRRHPHIVTYGFGEARPEVLTEIGVSAAFVAETGTSNSDALTLALSSMIHSFVYSARNNQFTIAASVPHMTTLRAPADYVY